MKPFDWNDEKNEWLRQERGISFEDIVFHLSRDGLLAILEHPNLRLYPGQRIFVVNVEGYACIAVSYTHLDVYKRQEIARSERYHEGSIPLQTLRADIDYGFAEADTTYGKLGVKVWIYKGEVLPLSLIHIFRQIGKLRRQGVYVGRRPTTKKAVIKLTPDSKTIEFFEGMA